MSDDTEPTDDRPKPTGETINTTPVLNWLDQPEFGARGELYTMTVQYTFFWPVADAQSAMLLSLGAVGGLTNDHANAHLDTWEEDESQRTNEVPPWCELSEEDIDEWVEAGREKQREVGNLDDGS